MSKYRVKRTSVFKKDFKNAVKSGLDISEFKKVIDLLQNGEQLPEKYKDHKLTGKWKNYRDCHITPDWVLIYQYQDDKLILVLARTGSHSKLKL